jgi:hypothetical protein
MLLWYREVSNEAKKNDETRKFIFQCFHIRLHEAESILVGSSLSINTLALDDFVHDHGDQAAFALQLLAKVCE